MAFKNNLKSLRNSIGFLIKKMDQLPSELLCIIFGYLDFEALIDSSRNVCKKWMKIIEENNVKLKTIVLNEDKLDPFVLKLFQTNQIINYKSSLVAHSINYIERKRSLINVWRNIRKLIIFNCDLDFNQFESLEHLETHCNKVIDLKRVPQLIRINLKKLKILTLLLELSIYTNYVLDTPELHSLRTTNIENFELIYPFNLQALECHVYNDCIKRFKKLKLLICNRIDLYDGRLLRHLLELKEFQINCIDKGDLNAMLKEKDELKLIELKIIIKGIVIIRKEYLEVLLNNDFEILSSSNQQLFLDNYDCLSNNLHFISDFFVDFNMASLPACLYSKLSNLKGIVVHHLIEDEISWTFLLKSSHLIHTIKIFHPISQYFCDLIPFYCPNLNTLSIQKAFIGDFKFVCNFENLERFTTDQELQIDEFRMLIEILNHNKFLKFITFKFKKIDFKVEKLEEEIYCEYYKCVLIRKLPKLIEELKSTKLVSDLILQMKNISNFNKDDFKGKLFRLCFKFRNFGICDQPLAKVIDGFDFKI